jgi:hypothetical protein
MALSKIDVANMVTGATPVANGGTGLTSGTTNQFLKFTGSTTLASAADNAGKVLKVENGASIGGNTSTTSTSYVTTGAVESITPTAASSKILLQFVVPTNTGQGNTSCKVRVYRQVNGGGYSSVGDDATFNTVYFHSNAGAVNQLCTIQWYDSPSYSLGNAIDYKLYMASSDGGAVNVYNEGGNKNNLLLWELTA